MWHTFWPLVNLRLGVVGGQTRREFLELMEQLRKSREAREQKRRRPDEASTDEVSSIRRPQSTNKDS